jgi:hypothetical protein
MKNFKIFFVLTKHHLDLEPDVSSAGLPTNLKRSTYYVDKYRQREASLEIQSNF